jgi:hypothetical protein
MVLLPGEEAQVWFRRTPWYDTPVLGNFVVATLSFDVSVYTADGASQPLLQVPFYIVHSWKFRLLAEEQAYQAIRQPDWPK